ncbi:MAG: hypothetical protein NTX25_13275 [Proteobacteria bacterium]|nr:hypothetical protein [Pseudomonadota bacterium]
MSLAAWFFPLLLLLVSVPSPDQTQLDSKSERRQIWEMLLDILGLLPWIFSLISDQALAAWMGFELFALILIIDLLWMNPKQGSQEAWYKLSTNWFLAWLLVGLAACLAGLGPLPERLLFPIPSYLSSSVQSALAAALFTVGLALKLGLPPVQQGVIDAMGTMDAACHRRWALSMKLGLIYAIWQIAPSIWGTLQRGTQQFFALTLIAGFILSCLVASVQAGVQRTLSYLGSIIVLPAMLGALLLDPHQGFELILVWGIWLMISLGFIVMVILYRQSSSSLAAGEQTLLWIDESSPVLAPSWWLSWKLWIAWGVCMASSLSLVAGYRQYWYLAASAILLALSLLTVGSLQMGIQLRRRGSPLASSR